MTSHGSTKMKKTSKKSNVQITVAIITAAAVVIAALVGIFPDIIKGLTNKDFEKQVTIIVSDSNGSLIDRANVLLFYEGGVVNKYTDTHGVASFNANVSYEMKARLIVETSNYEIYEQEIDLSRDTNLQIRLQQKAIDTSTVIVRVIDATDSQPVSMAKVLLLVEGDIYNQLTDSNGIAKFTIKFPSDTIEAEISVSTSRYEIEYQRITLLPNRVQDVQLNPQTGDISSLPPKQTLNTTAQSSPSLSSTNTPIPSVDTDSLVAYQIEMETGSTEPGQGVLNVLLFKGDGTPGVGNRFRIYKQQQDLAGNWVVNGSSVTSGYTDSTGVASFNLAPGLYILNSDFFGYNWGDAYDVNGIANVSIESGKITNVRIELAQLFVGFLRADNTPISNQRVRIYLQKQDLAGNWVVDGSSIIYGFTDNTGAVTFNLVPGHYIINSNFNGYNWGNAYDLMGVANFALPSGQVTNLIQHLGRLTVGLTDGSGSPLQGKRVSVFFQKQDVSNNTIMGDKVTYGYTDNTGTVSFDLTPGLYAVQIGDLITYNVAIEAGKITFGDGKNFSIQP